MCRKTIELLIIVIIGSFMFGMLIDHMNAINNNIRTSSINDTVIENETITISMSDIVVPYLSQTSTVIPPEAIRCDGNNNNDIWMMEEDFHQTITI